MKHYIMIEVREDLGATDMSFLRMKIHQVIDEERIDAATGVVLDPTHCTHYLWRTEMPFEEAETLFAKMYPPKYRKVRP